MESSQRRRSCVVRGCVVGSEGGTSWFFRTRKFLPALPAWAWPCHHRGRTRVHVSVAPAVAVRWTLMMGRDASCPLPSSGPAAQPAGRRFGPRPSYGTGCFSLPAIWRILATIVTVLIRASKLPWRPLVGNGNSGANVA